MAGNALTRRSIVQSPTFSTGQRALKQELKALGQFIRSERIRRRLRTVDVATAAGVSTVVLTRVEGGKSIRTDSLLKILHSLGLTRSWLEHVHPPKNSASEKDQQSARAVPYHELPIFYASQLKITPRRTPEDIRRAMAEGRFAEMGGDDEDET